MNFTTKRQLIFNNASKIKKLQTSNKILNIYIHYAKNISIFFNNFFIIESRNKNEP